MSAALPVKGERFQTYPEERMARRHLVTVTRVAKDGSWADISVRTWAVMWTKRQPTPIPKCEPWSGNERTWFADQEEDHMDMLRERGDINV